MRPNLSTFGSVRPFRSTRSNREQTHRYLDSLCAECWNFANINDIVTYMPPFRGFTMIHRVKVGTDQKRSLFRLLHPLRYHVHYDLPGLYKKLTSQTVEASDDP